MQEYELVGPQLTVTKLKAEATAYVATLQTVDGT